MLVPMQMARDERGVIGLVPTIIALLVGGAAAAVMIASVSWSSSRNQEPDVYVGITDAHGTRDGQGRPHIQIKYKVAVANNRPLSFLPEARVQCFVLEEGGQQRVFTGEAVSFLAEGTSRDTSMTITPPQSANNLEGTARVRCEISRSGRGYTSKSTTVTVPGPNGATGSSVDTHQYEGVYAVTMTLANGVLVNCDVATRHRTFTVKALSNDKISLEIGGEGTDSLGITSFDTTLTQTAQFSGQVFLIPGDATWNGLLTGAFTMTGGLSSVQGKYERGDGHCTYDFTGSLTKAADAGTLAVSLEDVPGVDGCEPVLSKSTTKAGHASFKVTNNTSGFAQIYIYDAEHNLAAHNKQDIPKKGGSVTFTAELVTGTYDVMCDGPGSEDKTVKLTVE